MDAITGVLNFPRRLLWRVRIHRWGIGYPDPELRYLSKLCSPVKISIDVGASLGLYTSHLLTCSRAVWAFEPRKTAASELKRVFSDSPVQVCPLALSDMDDELTMVICDSDLGRSTLEQANPIAGTRETVTTRRLDSFDLSGVGFIKIDVEGHEEAVLHGGIETIQRNRPNILIEIEERHKPHATERIPRMLEDIGYSGWFLHESKWYPISTFDASQYQREGESPYINNFVFLPFKNKNLLI